MPEDPRVEEAARVIWGDQWDELAESVRGYWREKMAVVLAAADAVTPAAAAQPTEGTNGDLEELFYDIAGWGSADERNVTNADHEASSREAKKLLARMATLSGARVAELEQAAGLVVKVDAAGLSRADAIARLRAVLQAEEVPDV